MTIFIKNKNLSAFANKFVCPVDNLHAIKIKAKIPLTFIF